MNFMAVLIYATQNPLKSSLYYHWSTLKGSYHLKSLHKLVLPENVLISYFCGMEMYKTNPSSCFDQFSNPPNPPKSPLHYQWCTCKCSCSSKRLHKLVPPENELISYFCSMGMSKRYPKIASDHFDQFSNPLTHSKAFYITTEVHSRAIILPKDSTS